MDSIPYTVKPRPDTGVYNAKLGVWLFLASEIMLFGALFSTYIILRVLSPNWPLGSTLLNVPLGTVNTIILITSSITMVFAWTSLKQNAWGKHKVYLGLTIALALVFLVIKSFEYGAKFEHHHLPSSSTYFAIYFTLTGLHAIHILGGVVVLSYFFGPGAKMYKTKPEQFTNRMEVVGLYWHFVDLVWIFLFPVLYLL